MFWVAVGKGGTWRYMPPIDIALKERHSAEIVVCEGRSEAIASSPINTYIS